MNSRRNKTTGPVPVPGGSYYNVPGLYSESLSNRSYSSHSKIRSQYSREEIQSMQPTVEDVPDEGDPLPKTPPLRPIDTGEAEARQIRQARGSKVGKDSPFRYQVDEFDIDCDVCSTVGSASNISTNTSGISASETRPDSWSSSGTEGKKTSTTASAESRWGFGGLRSAAASFFGSKEETKQTQPPLPKRESPPKPKLERFDPRPKQDSPPPPELSPRAPAPYGGTAPKNTFSTKIPEININLKKRDDYDEAYDAANILNPREKTPYTYNPSRDDSPKAEAAVPGGGNGVYKIDDKFRKLNIREGNELTEKGEDIFGPRTPAPYARTQPSTTDEDYFSKPVSYGHTDGPTKEGDSLGKRTPAPYASTQVPSQRFCASPGRQETEWAKSKPQIHQQNPPPREERLPNTPYQSTYSSKAKPREREEPQRAKTPAPATPKVEGGMPTPGGTPAIAPRNENIPQTPKQQSPHTSPYTAYQTPNSSSVRTSSYPTYSVPATPSSLYGQYSPYSPTAQSPQSAQQGSPSQYQFQSYESPTQSPNSQPPPPVPPLASQPPQVHQDTPSPQIHQHTSPQIHQHIPPQVHQQFPSESSQPSVDAREFPQSYRGSQPRHRANERERPLYNYVNHTSGPRKSRQNAYYAQSEPTMPSNLYSDFHTGPKTDILDSGRPSGGGYPHRGSSKKSGNSRHSSRHEQNLSPILPKSSTTSSSSQQGILKPAQPPEHPLNGKKGFLRQVPRHQPGNPGLGYGKQYYTDERANPIEIYDPGDAYSDDYRYRYLDGEGQIDEDDLDEVAVEGKYNGPQCDCIECWESIAGHRGGIRRGDGLCGSGRCCFDPACMVEH